MPRTKKQIMLDALNRSLTAVTFPLVAPGYVGYKTAKSTYDLLKEALPELMYRPPQPAKAAKYFELAGLGTASGAPGAPRPVPGTVDVGLVKRKLFPFNLKTTDLGAWDAVFQKPLYHKRAKGMSARIEFMSPEEYFNKVYEGTGYTRRAQERVVNPQLVADYAHEMSKGSKFPIPGLEYQGEKYLGQEGRHRMLAAEKLGMDRVPVLVVRKVPEKALPSKYYMDATTIAPGFTDEAKALGKTLTPEEIPLIKEEMFKWRKRSAETMAEAKATKDLGLLDRGSKEAYVAQFYHEILQQKGLRFD